jgi:hypothetical protein
MKAALLRKSAVVAPRLAPIPLNSRRLLATVGAGVPVEVQAVAAVGKDLAPAIVIATGIGNETATAIVGIGGIGAVEGDSTPVSRHRRRRPTIEDTILDTALRRRMEPPMRRTTSTGLLSRTRTTIAVDIIRITLTGTTVGGDSRTAIMTETTTED